MGLIPVLDNATNNANAFKNIIERKCKRKTCNINLWCIFLFEKNMLQCEGIEPLQGEKSKAWPGLCFDLNILINWSQKSILLVIL